MKSVYDIVVNHFLNNIAVISYLNKTKQNLCRTSLAEKSASIINEITTVFQNLN